MDAGPHVKVLTLEPHVEVVRARLAEIDGVTRVIVSAPGGPATVVEQE
jgi:hypothetical protein